MVGSYYYIELVLSGGFPICQVRFLQGPWLVPDDRRNAATEWCPTQHGVLRCVLIVPLKLLVTTVICCSSLLIPFHGKVR